MANPRGIIRKYNRSHLFFLLWPGQAPATIKCFSVKILDRGVVLSGHPPQTKSMRTTSGLELKRVAHYPQPKTRMRRKSMLQIGVLKFNEEQHEDRTCTSTQQAPPVRVPMMLVLRHSPTTLRDRTVLEYFC